MLALSSRPWVNFILKSIIINVYKDKTFYNLYFMNFFIVIAIISGKKVFIEFHIYN